MRGTLHLVTADDCLLLRPLVQPVLDRELVRHSEYGRSLDGVDLDEVMAFAGPLLAERPRTGPQLRAALAERFPDLHAAALAYACRNRAGLRPGAAEGRVGQVGAGHVDHCRSVVGSSARGQAVDRRGRRALPARLRAGVGRRRRGLVRD